MEKPEDCPLKLEFCEQCKYWEPIPFHDNGGLCVASRRCSPASAGRSHAAKPLAASAPRRIGRRRQRTRAADKSTTKTST